MFIGYHGNLLANKWSFGMAKFSDTQHMAGLVASYSTELHKTDYVEITAPATRTRQRL